MYQNPNMDGWNSFIKFIITVIPALGIYIGISVKSGKAKFLNAITSGLIGVGFAWIMNGVVTEYFSHVWYAPVIGALAITGRDVANWLIFKFKISHILDKVQDFLMKKYLKK